MGLGQTGGFKLYVEDRADLGLDALYSATQTLIGDVGARMNQLEVTGANLNALEITLTTFRSDLHEIDFEEAVTELVGRQTAFQAAM